MFQYCSVIMEGLFSASQRFQQKQFGNRKEGDMKPDEKPQVEGGTTDEGKLNFSLRVCLN